MSVWLNLAVVRDPGGVDQSLTADNSDDRNNDNTSLTRGALDQIYQKVLNFPTTNSFLKG